MQENHVVELMQLKSFFGADTLEELCDLIEKYPYFQIAHLLYSLVLKENEDDKYHSELRKTSCYIGDRKQLLIRIEEGFQPFIEKMEEERSKNGLRSSFDLINFYLSNEIEEETELPILFQKNEDTENHQNAEVLLTDYAMHALNDDKDLPDKDTIFFKYQEVIDQFLEKDKESPIKIELREDEITEEIKTVEKEEIIPIEKIEISIQPEIKQEEIEEIPVSEEKTIIQEEINQEITDKVANENPEKTPEELKTKENVPPLKYQDIIDRFIEEDKSALPIKIKLRDEPTEKKKEIPKISVSKKKRMTNEPVKDKMIEEKQPEEKNESQKIEDTEKEISITEEMAKMYLQQKKYDKALEIINKLNLIYPKKKRYFADQIRFLEKVINNTKK